MNVHLSLLVLVAVATCSTANTVCGHGSDDQICARSKDKNGKCFPSVTFDRAKSICGSIGFRLCKLSELTSNEAAYTGCGYNAQRIWSSTSCGPGKYETTAGATKWAAEHSTKCTSKSKDLHFRCCLKKSGKKPKPAASEFKIKLRNKGGFSTKEMGYFGEAAKRWEQVIKGLKNNSSVVVHMDEDAYRGKVHGILIDVETRDIDGPGGVLGTAGPRSVRLDSLIPYYGVMTFDKSDIDRLRSSGPAAVDSLKSVAAHEMAHVLGLGTTWNWWKNEGKLVTGAGSDNPRFTGSNAVKAYGVVRGKKDKKGVPIENVGGAGTRDSHWREATFDKEIFTGWIDSMPELPISRVTVGALNDLGYTVNMEAADDMTISNKLPTVLQPGQPYSTSESDFYCCHGHMIHSPPST
eukprot:CAMPEP_0198331392 /NCGR_PEP_ID=MMETSP1450-20131203/17559_1 /TAXON_ID=753684 ORGANISM="Madagascaria erythrocladiodes, Strain CCMP3234" /NCGR_SAMPLE_ID=MMETSP1450 /ASSEMBLY_ACC=CAM_ASM_001115 /LENGTH=407 /DNA_ID=CAMNT_0044035757 /DNA_START=152 /DNA_END=1372 /DNA_ORIENTATION=+